jgi:hypothetical protein
MKTANNVECRPATAEEREAISLLRGITFGPSGPDRAFVRKMREALESSDARDEPLEITERQADYLRRLVIRFRRQIARPQ